MAHQEIVATGSHKQLHIHTPVSCASHGGQQRLVGHKIWAGDGYPPTCIVDQGSEHAQVWFSGVARP